MINGITVLAAILLSPACKEYKEINGGSETGECIVHAAIVPVSSKTSIAENGLTVLWSEADEISVFTYENSQYVNHKFTLNSGAGEADATFKGPALSSAPVCAIYPYCSDPVISYGKITLSLGSEISLSEMMNEGDFKIATSVTGDAQSGYSFSFLEKMSLLEFRIVPTDEMLTGGDKIQRISIKAPSTRSIASNFKLNLSNASEAASVLNGGSSSATAVVMDQISVSGTRKAGMFVLPGIKSGDSLTVTVTTDKRSILAYATAATDYLQGMRYTMTLDLPKLLSDGKVYFIEKNAFYDNTTDLGVFDISDKDNPAAMFILDNRRQIGYTSNSFRVQHFSAGMAVNVVFPDGMMMGKSYDMTVSAYGFSNMSSGVKSLQLGKVDGNRMWLVDNKLQQGYIIQN